MDHDLRPPWTSINIAKAIESGLFTQPPAQCTIENNIAHQMVNNGLLTKNNHGSPTHPRAPNLSLSPLEEWTIAK